MIGAVLCTLCCSLKKALASLPIAFHSSFHRADGPTTIANIAAPLYFARYTVAIVLEYFLSGHVFLNEMGRNCRFCSYKRAASSICPQNVQSYFTFPFLALSLTFTYFVHRKASSVWQMTPAEKAVILPQRERRFCLSVFYISPFFLSGGGRRRRGECESVNVLHSPDIIHKFHKAGICSIRSDYCAIEGGWKGLIQASAEKNSPQQHSSGEQRPIEQENPHVQWGVGGDSSTYVQLQHQFIFHQCRKTIA